MRTINGFEKVMSIGKGDLNGLTIEESLHSPLVTAKEKTYVSKKKIILTIQMTEHESELFMRVSKNKGGLIV